MNLLTFRFAENLRLFLHRHIYTQLRFRCTLWYTLGVGGGGGSRISSWLCLFLRKRGPFITIMLQILLIIDLINTGKPILVVYIVSALLSCIPFCFQGDIIISTHTHKCTPWHGTHTCICISCSCSVRK